MIVVRNGLIRSGECINAFPTKNVGAGAHDSPFVRYRKMSLRGVEAPPPTGKGEGYRKATGIVGRVDDLS